MTDNESLAWFVIIFIGAVCSGVLTKRNTSETEYTYNQCVTNNPAVDEDECPLPEEQ